MMTEEELQKLRQRHVEDTSLTEMMGSCRCGSLVFPCQTSRLVAEVDRLRAEVEKQTLIAESFKLAAKDIAKQKQAEIDTLWTALVAATGTGPA